MKRFLLPAALALVFGALLGAWHYHEQVQAIRHQRDAMNGALSGEFVASLKESSVAGSLDASRLLATNAIGRMGAIESRSPEKRKEHAEIASRLLASADQEDKVLALTLLYYSETCSAMTNPAFAREFGELKAKPDLEPALHPIVSGLARCGF